MIRNLKVLYAASSAAHLESFHGPYIRRLAENGCQVYSLCGGRPRLEGISGNIELGFKKSLLSPANFITAIRIAGVLRTENFDLIWAHTSLAAFFVRLAVILAGKGKSKVVNTVHGYLFDDDTPPLKRAVLLAAERLTAGVTDLAVTMNRYDYELAARKRLAKTVASVDGAGVNFDKFSVTDKKTARKALGLPENAIIMIYAAEFSKRKNQSFLIECMSALPDKVLLLLAGRGALEGGCRALAERAGVSGRVVFAGHISDLSPYYSAADICVSSSRSEGLPFNVMESMYFALPAVASRVKGHIDLIDEGRNGYLYAYGDKNGFIEHIERLAGDEELRRRLGTGAKSSVERYALDRVLPAAFELLEKHLSF